MAKEQQTVIHLAHEDIARIHDRTVSRIGGSTGIINKGILEFIAEVVFSRFNNQELSESVVKKAALLLFELITQHPFVDGNKRTAFGACEEFLNLNGFEFNFDPADAEKLALEIASGKSSISHVEKWVQKQARQAA